MILYNRKKVKYRKDGYCWKKRKDGKTTREDHMKLKVQGVEVRGCNGKTSRWCCLAPSMVSLPILSITYSPSLWGDTHVLHKRTHKHTKLQANVLPESEWCPSIFISLPAHVPVSLPLSVSLSLFLKDKSVFGLRPWMMSMPPSAEQRGVSIQSQGSVCACVSVCVCVWATSASSKIDYSAGIYQEVRGVSMHVSETKNEVEGRVKETGGTWMFAEGSIVLHWK